MSTTAISDDRPLSCKVPYTHTRVSASILRCNFLILIQLFVNSSVVSHLHSEEQ